MADNILVIADRIKETSTTTGTGSFALAGAMTGFRRFNVVAFPGDVLFYTIQAVDSAGQPTGQWEIGYGTYSALNTLARTTVLDSSTLVSGLPQLVNFATGSKQVWIDWPARQVNRTQFRGENGNYGFGIGAYLGEPARQKIHVVGNVLVKGIYYLYDADIGTDGARWQYVTAEQTGYGANIVWGIGTSGCSFGMNEDGLTLFEGKGIAFMSGNPLSGLLEETHRIHGGVGAPNDADGRPDGSVYIRKDGANCFYRKESGAYVVKF